MSHFYDNKGQLHECDIKEARANKWVAGTTEIIYEFSNSFGLDLYKQKQMFMASLTMPRPKGITDEAFYDLVVEDSQVHSEKAKQFGIGVHNIVTAYLENGYKELTILTKDSKRCSDQIYEWIRANKDPVIIDIKTTETKDGKYRQPYVSWLFQLCGYLMGIEDRQGEFINYGFSDNGFGGTVDYALLDIPEEIKLINLIVSSNEDIPIKIYPWKPEKIDWGCQVFNKMVELYNIIKKLN